MIFVRKCISWFSDHRIGQWWRTTLCRWLGHPGVIWYRSYGTEPDYHCKRCGEDLQ